MRILTEVMGDSVFFDRQISYLGDFTWNSMSGRSVQLKPVPIQSLSELERVRLQEVAFYRLHQDYDLGCQITIPKDGQNLKKSLRRKLDSLAKEKNKDKEFVPQAFGLPLSQVITNDRTHKQRQDPQRGEHRDPSDLVSSILQFAIKRPSKELSSSNSSLSSTPETPNETTSPNTPEMAPRTRRRGAMSVDSITDLDDNQSRLLEALQLSLPAERPSKKEKRQDKKLSLNPIYRQVPRLVDSCCQHLEKYGMQTVGIFRVGSSKKRVRQLREEFDRGMDVLLDEEHSVHDVAALLKEFLRDMPDPLLTKELYTAFINTMLLDREEQQSALQLLIYLLPPCNSDTLHRLLEFLSRVAAHASDGQDKDGQEITGNKMTSLNLATIFGPNLLHKQKSSDKEFSVQSSARAEESAAVIAVVQRMISTYEALFTVLPELQNEVLMSLLETDPDVVDYLLRRKASQWSSPDLLTSDAPFSLTQRRCSSDSNKASSGEVSPYDNNSPVLSDHLPPQHQGDSSPGTDGLFHTPEHYTLPGHTGSRAKEPCSAPWSVKDEHTNIWGARHANLRSGEKDQPNKGSRRCVSKSISWNPSEVPCGHPGNRKTPVQWTQSSSGVAECGPHSLDTCASSILQGGGGNKQLQLSPDTLSFPPEGLSKTVSSKELPRGGGFLINPPHVSDPAPKNDSAPLSPSHRSTGRTPTASLSTAAQQVAPQTQQPSLRNGSPGPVNESLQTAAGSTGSKGLASPEWQDWQRERWQIWQLLSLDNTDTLPETLV
ncbi:hypothetical protein MATL_G00179910 [Megalops atlanticus]|uniref:Rho-GAP domain-containing protein n=1 Tax=Megalops atlanticus TaxID=7932 RepID=A0A9D3PP77_MEGAT|nr:hypothetical protein MATL_G00179910 [Megalops atlanticus]